MRFALCNKQMNNKSLKLTSIVVALMLIFNLTVWAGNYDNDNSQLEDISAYDNLNNFIQFKALQYEEDKAELFIDNDDVDGEIIISKIDQKEYDSGTLTEHFIVDFNEIYTFSIEIQNDLSVLNLDGSFMIPSNQKSDDLFVKTLGVTSNIIQAVPDDEIDKKVQANDEIANQIKDKDEIANQIRDNSEMVDDAIEQNDFILGDEMIISPMAAGTVYEVESNNTYSAADRTYDDYDVYGKIYSTASDIDWYKVKFDSNGSANFWLGSIPSSCDYELDVYSSNGTSRLGYSHKGSNANEQVTLDVTANQYYYIKITSYSGYSSSYYLFRAKNYPVVQTDDHGNTRGDATTIGLDTSVSGVIDYAGDLDYFRFTVSAPGTYSLYSTGSIDTYGYLYNSSGSVIEEQDDDEDANFKIVRLLNSGTYYLAVRHFSSSSTGSYRVEVSSLGKNAIIFIPGAMGSRLDYGTERVWEPTTADVLDLIWIQDMYPKLRLDEDGFPYEILSPVNDGQGADNAYESINDFLQDEYSTKYYVEFFPYDWRLNVTSAASKLQQRINGQGYDNVILVAHSMGGLVASSYIESSTANQNKVQLLFTAGTPYAGAAKAIGTMEDGTLLGLPDLILGAQMQDIASNSFGAYQLLPTSRLETPYLYIDGAGQSHTAASSFLSDRFWAEKADGSTKPMFSNAASFHSGLIVNGEHIAQQVRYAYVAGTGVFTPKSAWYTYGSLFDSFMASTIGDGTVMQDSARNVDGDYYSITDVPHAELYNDSTVQNWVEAEIDAVLAETSANRAFQSQDSPEEEAPFTSIVLQGFKDVRIFDSSGEQFLERNESLYLLDDNGKETYVGAVWTINEETNRKQYVLKNIEFNVLIDTPISNSASEIKVEHMKDGKFINSLSYDNINSDDSMDLHIETNGNTKLTTEDGGTIMPIMIPQEELDQLNMNLN